MRGGGKLRVRAGLSAAVESWQQKSESDRTTYRPLSTSALFNVNSRPASASGSDFRAILCGAEFAFALAFPGFGMPAARGVAQSIGRQRWNVLGIGLRRHGHNLRVWNLGGRRGHRHDRRWSRFGNRHRSTQRSGFGRRHQACRRFDFDGCGTDVAGVSRNWDGRFGCSGPATALRARGNRFCDELID